MNSNSPAGPSLGAMSLKLCSEPDCHALVPEHLFVAHQAKHKSGISMSGSAQGSAQTPVLMSQFGGYNVPVMLATLQYIHPGFCNVWKLSLFFRCIHRHLCCLIHLWCHHQFLLRHILFKINSRLRNVPLKRCPWHHQLPLKLPNRFRRKNRCHLRGLRFQLMVIFIILFSNLKVLTFVLCKIFGIRPYRKAWKTESLPALWRKRRWRLGPFDQRSHGPAQIFLLSSLFSHKRRKSEHSSHYRKFLQTS